MKGSTEVLENLNLALEGELYAIMQYILFSETCEDWGYHKLAAAYKSEAIQEMGHAERLVERIVFLEGTPHMTMNREIKADRNMQKNLEMNLQAEMDGIAIYRDGIDIAREKEDNGTRKMLEEILKQEEDHVDWIEAQMNIIDQVGLENYLAQQMHG